MCIRSRAAGAPYEAPRAIFVLGEAPGFQEDTSGQPFVGPSGEILKDWLACCGFAGSLDIYLGNVVRCRPPGNDTPKPKHVSACWGYLLRDLELLRGAYEEVILLTVGASSTEAVRSCTLTKSFRAQGASVQVGPASYRCFSTYHPAYTMPGRNPAAGQAVADHLNLLCRYVSGDWHPDDRSTNPYSLGDPAPSYRIPLLSLDIETYGLVKGLPPQNYFVPAHSLAYDGVARDQLIQIVGLAWKGPDGELCSTVLDWQRASHRGVFRKYIAQADCLLLKNAQFDLAYLRAVNASPLLNHKLLVEDVDVWNYLDSDVRPERSLKSLSPLLGLPAYEDGGFKQYESRLDPQALEYVTKDAVDTLLLRDTLRSNILTAYKDDARIKLSSFTHRWYSDLIWLGVYMTETGIAKDRPVMLKTRAEVKKEFETVQSVEGMGLFTDYDVINFAGKGSQKQTRALVHAAIAAAGLINHPELDLTDKTSEISTGQANIYLLLGNLEPDSPFYEPIKSLQRFRLLQKYLSTYLNPQLGPFKFKKGKYEKEDALQATSDARIGVVHPRWHIVPSGWSSSEDEVSGTKQGRITCKGPPEQTMPRAFRAFRTTRWLPGYFLGLDLSQIELRMAAYLSQDPDMLGEYARGVDRHWLRAVELFPDGCKAGHGAERNKGCEECDLIRQVGKTTNFLIIYMGGAWRLRLTLRMEVGYETTLSWCHEVVRKSHARYPHYMAYADRNIREVTSKGYIMDPITGAGRYVPRGYRAGLSDKAIVNFPIQTASANLLLAGQTALEFQLRDLGLQSRVVHNEYDALYVDGPKAELGVIEPLVYSCLRNSEYLQRLQDRFGGMPFPLEAEHKVVYRE